MGIFRKMAVLIFKSPRFKREELYRLLGLGSKMLHNKHHYEMWSHDTLCIYEEVYFFF